MHKPFNSSAEQAFLSLRPSVQMTVLNVLHSIADARGKVAPPPLTKMFSTEAQRRAYRHWQKKLRQQKAAQVAR